LTVVSSTVSQTETPEVALKMSRISPECDAGGAKIELLEHLKVLHSRGAIETLARVSRARSARGKRFMDIVPDVEMSTISRHTIELTTQLNRISTIFTLWSIVDVAGSRPSPAWSELLGEAEKAIDRAKGLAGAIGNAVDRT
jgi:hypothetical protein